MRGYCKKSPLVCALIHQPLHVSFYIGCWVIACNIENEGESLLLKFHIFHDIHDIWEYEGFRSKSDILIFGYLSDICDFGLIGYTD